MSNKDIIAIVISLIAIFINFLTILVNLGFFDWVSSKVEDIVDWIQERRH